MMIIKEIKMINAFYVFYVLVALCGFGGWVANIYKLITCGLDLAQFGVLEVVRVIGIFLPPIGAVLGFF